MRRPAQLSGDFEFRSRLFWGGRLRWPAHAAGGRLRGWQSFSEQPSAGARRSIWRFRCEIWSIPERPFASAHTHASRLGGKSRSVSERPSAMARSSIRRFAEITLEISRPLTSFHNVAPVFAVFAYRVLFIPRPRSPLQRSKPLNRAQAVMFCILTAHVF